MFTLYHADSVGNASNCRYPHRVEIRGEEDLRRAVRFDYVCASYKGAYRSGDNFLSGDCLAFDVDNDLSESPEDWVTPEKLRALRAERGMTARELAEEIGVSFPTIYRWESGDRIPDITMLMKLCRILGVSSDMLLCGTGEPNPPADT